MSIVITKTINKLSVDRLKTLVIKFTNNTIPLHRNLQYFKLIALLITAIVFKVQAQQVSINLGIQAENYYIQSFDLLNSNHNNSINLIPDVNYGIYLGYKFLARNTFYLGGNIGSSSSRFTIYNEQSTPVGKVLLKDKSYQYHLSYSYSVPVNTQMSIEPSLILTYNQNSFMKRTPKTLKIHDNFNDLSLVSRVLASKDLNYYFTGGLGVRFSFKISDRLQLSLLSSYHHSFIPNYLLGIYGTVRNDSIKEDIRQQIVLNTGARIGNSFTLGYIINHIR